MKKKRERVLPMPTEEEKMRARMKLTGADPLVWAMKSVDDKFPDEREKSVETVKAEAEVEQKLGPANVTDEARNGEVDVEETDEDFAQEFGDDLDDSEILDDSDILADDEELDSTEMIDKISATKRAEKAKKVEAEKKVAKVEPGETKEIIAEDKLTMPTDEGVVTMEVTPMRQDVSDVSPEEVKKARAEEETEDIEPDTAKSKFVLKGKKAAASSDTADAGTQVKLMNLEFKQKKMMIGLAVLVLLATAGVVFGIVATVKQSQAAEDFANQIAEANETKESDGIEGDSVNIKDWNLKIKIIEGLVNVSYNTFMDDYAEVQIWGAKKDVSANYVPDFAKQSKNSSPLGTVVRVPRYERAAAGRLIWYDDYYNYYYQGPSGVPNVSEEEMSWWVESYLLVKEMLTNADNYTTN